jgi:hypothetical protein
MRNPAPALALTLLSLQLLACSKPGSSTPSGPVLPAAENFGVTGTIVERVDEAPYSYLRLETQTGPVWAAVPIASSFEAGTKISIVNGAWVRDVQARGRKFDSVVFGTLKR